MNRNDKRRAMKFIVPVMILGLFGSAAQSASAASVMSESRDYASSKATRDIMLGDRMTGVMVPTHPVFWHQSQAEGFDAVSRGCRGTSLDKRYGAC